MLINEKIIKKIFKKNFNLCLFYDNFMLINVKLKKKNVFHRTDTRTTQNYSSEPHNILLSALKK